MDLFDNILNSVITFCKKKKSRTLLYFISFIESIFFPIPTDPFLIPYIIASKKFYKLVFFTTLFSVLGGILAYFIGKFFWIEIKDWFELSFPSASASVESFDEKFQAIGFMLILIGGFSPFPYKITCLTSGILEINLLMFVLLSFISRGARFFIVGYIIFKYGERSISLIKRYIFQISLFLVIFFLIYSIFFHFF